MKDWRITPPLIGPTHWYMACDFEAIYTRNWDLRYHIGWKAVLRMDQARFLLEECLKETGSKEKK